MADFYVSDRFGNDSTGNGSINNPYKTPPRIANVNPGAGGHIYFDAGSDFEVNPTLAANFGVAMTTCNGSAGNPAIITAYYPPGTDPTRKPVFRYRMKPAAGDWQWDSTLTFGVARGWYLQFAWSMNWWDVMVMVAGQYVGTTNQDTDSNKGQGYINGGHPSYKFNGQYVNLQGYDVLRFNFDYGGSTVNGATGPRLYLSGAGLHNPAIDPTTYFGAGQIVLGLRPLFSFYGAGNYTRIENLRFEDGGGAVLMQAADNTVITGFEMTGCEFTRTCQPVRFNTGAGTAAATKWTVDVHDNIANLLSGPFCAAFGPGLAGYIRRNQVSDNNLCSSMGGAFYMQVNPSTYGGTRDPVIVEANKVWRARNGAGNNAFDGCCYYADINDNGTVWRGNWAYDSYCAFQTGSGKRSDIYGNFSVNCQKFAMQNNATTNAQTNDYRVWHNLHISAAQGTYYCGQDADTHKYALTAYQSGDANLLVGGSIINNIFVNHPNDPTRIAIDAYQAAQWAAGKVQVANNLCIGYQAKQVVCDFGTDKTADSAPLPTDTVTGWINAAANDYRLTSSSGLIGAGLEVLRPSLLVDAKGQSFQSPPSVGPYEVQVKPSAFWQWGPA